MEDTLSTQIMKRLVLRRPNATSTTIKTYTSLIHNLVKSYDETLKLFPWDWVENHPGDVASFIQTFYADRPMTSIKTLFAALFTITGNDMYHYEMMALSKKVDKENAKQEKTQKQEENWLSFEQVERTFKSVYQVAKRYLNSKTPLTPSELQVVQEYIILCLTTGIYIPPRRSTDWIDMKLRGQKIGKKDTPEHNFIKGNKFHFLNYKTAKQYGEQTVDIPAPLKRILGKWKRLNPHDSLLITVDGNQMTNVRLTQILNKIFQRNVSTSMLRHIYITEKLGKDMPGLQDMKDMAEDMGHSVGMQLEYIKR